MNTDLLVLFTVFVRAFCRLGGEMGGELPSRAVSIYRQPSDCSASLTCLSKISSRFSPGCTWHLCTNVSVLAGKKSVCNALHVDLRFAPQFFSAGSPVRRMIFQHILLSFVIRDPLLADKLEMSPIN